MFCWTEDKKESDIPAQGGECNLSVGTFLCSSKCVIAWGNEHSQVKEGVSSCNFNRMTQRQGGSAVQESTAKLQVW